MDIGKPECPGEDGFVRGEEGRADGGGDGDVGLTYAEIVSELLFGGRTLAEIAGYDDYQIRWVVCRDRDKYGSLIRHKARDPERGEVVRQVTWEAMFRDLWNKRGFSNEQVEEKWQKYLLDNPSMVHYQEMGKRRRRKHR